MRQMWSREDASRCYDCREDVKPMGLLGGVRVSPSLNSPLFLIPYTPLFRKSRSSLEKAQSAGGY